MKYIRGMRGLNLVFSDNISVVLKWWIDASYEVHPNMQVHTGVLLYMEIGFPIVT